KGRIDRNESKTYKRSMVWARSISVYRKLTFSSSLLILLLGLLPSCSAQPQSHPLDTKPVPPDAQFLTECRSKESWPVSLCQRFPVITARKSARPVSPIEIAMGNSLSSAVPCPPGNPEFVLHALALHSPSQSNIYRIYLLTSNSLIA